MSAAAPYIGLAGELLSDTAAALAQWSAREERDGRSYVLAGMTALAKIDAVTDVLQVARQRLATELLDDERARRNEATS